MKEKGESYGESPIRFRRFPLAVHQKVPTFAASNH